MKTAYFGYGKMGRAVEAAALERGHTTAAIIDPLVESHSTPANHVGPDTGCDVAFEFSTPATAVDNILRCFDLGIPVVSGTTGWNNRMEEVADICRARGAALFVASNFSIGMNIMFELNRRLAELMQGRTINVDPDTGYEVAISETHHIHKLDAPSGTALVLADDIAAVTGGERPPITSRRIGEVPGIHEVVYDSPVDTLTLRHEAKNRKGLALGAVLAAEFLVGKKGIYTMRDLLNE